MVNKYILDISIKGLIRANQDPEPGIVVPKALRDRLNQLREFNLRAIYMSDRLRDAQRRLAGILEVLLEDVWSLGAKVREGEPGGETDFEEFVMDFFQKAGYTPERLADERCLLEATLACVASFSDGMALRFWEERVGFSPGW